MVAIGETVSHYRILEKLGGGGMGVVYKAEDTKLGRTVALKVLPPERVADPNRKRRFIQEARAASALNHPNIITIHDIDEVEGEHFIAMEYVDGKTLDRLIAHGLPLDKALKYAVEMAAALTKAHSAGIVHRDLKPTNIMVNSEGLVKVLDFGLAKLIEPELAADAETIATAEPRTEEGTVIGTVGYMSPEQAEGKPVDARSDIFSFGSVLYEMLVGQRAFQGETNVSTIAAILREEPKPLSQVDENLPREVERVVKRCLRKDREHRFQTMADLKVALEELKEESDSGELAKGPVAGAGSARLREGKALPYLRWVFAIAALALTAVLAVAYFVRFRGGRQAIDSIAVLPFSNAGGNPDAEYLSDGITESVINNLSQIPDLRVMARSTVFRFKGDHADPQKVGAELHVGAVMTGRLLQRGDTLIVRAELVDAQTGAEIWGEQYNRKLADVLAVQEDISREISQRLRLGLSGDQEKRLAKPQTENLEALQLYLKGRYEWNRRNLRKSLDYFNAAIQKDPGYALAYAGRSQVYSTAPADGLLPASEANPLAESDARRAVALDDDLVQGHLALAQVAVNSYDWPSAKKEYERALELNPGDAEVHYFYGFDYLCVRGQFDEAIQEMRRALDLDPLSPVVNAQLGTCLYMAGRADEALKQAEKTVELDTQVPYAHWEMALQLSGRGKYPEALAEAKKAYALSPANPQFLAQVGFIYARWGKRREALKVLEQLKAMSKTSYVEGYDWAPLYSALGEKDKAFTWLEKDLNQHTWRMTFLKLDSRFEPLRADPRFQALLRRMNFPQ